MRKDSSTGRPPGWSELLYIRMPRRDIAYFKFILESHEHLALPGVVDPREAVVQLRFAPDAQRELLDLLQALAGEMELEILDPPRPSARVAPIEDRPG